MIVQCVKCGDWHNFSPLGMVIVIHALQTGELLRITGEGVITDCLTGAFSDENIATFTKRYPKRKL